MAAQRLTVTALSFIAQIVSNFSDNPNLPVLDGGCDVMAFRRFFIITNIACFANELSTFRLNASPEEPSFSSSFSSFQNSTSGMKRTDLSRKLCDAVKYTKIL